MVQCILVDPPEIHSCAGGGIKNAKKKSVFANKLLKFTITEYSVLTVTIQLYYVFKTTCYKYINAWLL